MNKTKEKPWRENIVKLTHRFSRMLRKGKIQKTQNAPNEPFFFFLVGNVKRTQKNALIFL